MQITRGEDLQSISLRGLYPAGEGAGYAGGIISAAVDGLHIGDAIVADALGLARDAAATARLAPSSKY